MTRLAPLALVLAALVACDDTLFPTSVVETEYDADWKGVSSFFEDNCVSCHGGITPILPDAILEDVEAGAGAYVVPGDPDASKLWLVVSGQADVLMPQGATEPLPDETIDHIRQWIADGAEL